MTGKRTRLRPVDLAREHGLSTQAVRNYEQDGILPPAERTDSGYRIYTPMHAAALRAFLALVPGHGHATATEIMAAANRGRVDEALETIDRGHLQLVEDRRTLAAVRRALGELTGDPDDELSVVRDGNSAANHGQVRPAARRRSGGEPLTVGAIAHQLGIRASTVRSWERAGLAPARDPKTGYRVYGEADVRDARLIHQLRRGGYLLEQIAPLVAQVRNAGGTDPLRATLTEWQGRLDARAGAMLAGAARLHAYLEHA